jgi:alanyl-tRNA synthetase
MGKDKDIKKEYKKKFSKEPEKHYATSVLKKEGFERKQCKCGTWFWTASGSNTCGDPACTGGFSFFEDRPSKKNLDYIQVWQEFAKLFKKQGYTPIPRYPVVARWRKDTDFVQASIYDFQPYVVSGEVKPPANPLVVPQFCVRFNDIDNVGITGAHYTGFVMIGQHAFMPPKDFTQEKYFKDIHLWLKKCLGLPNKEITFHEDAWAGGGNFGPCMEFFSRGLELGNQVYMQYEQTASGPKELKLKVLDMGMGHERNAWFTKGTSTSYETTFPTVCKKMHSLTGIKVDDALMKKFLPYSAFLNVDEVDNIEKAWAGVAKKVGEDVNELRKKVLPLAAMYSVAEHSRSLLFTLNDGALPSNVGGGYNLRVILRRALSFIDQYGWNVDLADVCEWHAAYLKKLFPELGEHLDEVNKILEIEKSKYNATKNKTAGIVKKIVEKKVTNAQLLQLYDSQGISPEMVREEAAKLNKVIKIPENFYAQVAELHEKKEQEAATKKESTLDLDDVDETKALYFDDYAKVEFKAKVVKIIDKNVVLDKTYFYPTSGGQLHDIGFLNNQEVVDVFKQGNVIIHLLKDNVKFKVGEEVCGKVDIEWREQLAQHHTATHIINAAARRVLGHHVNQASAKKTKEKAQIDVTHYESLTDDEIKKIEVEANKIVKEGINIRSTFMPREKAEKSFGMEIYQGGVVPGKDLRIIEIPEVDVECCGGTHLDNTSKVGVIKIVKSTKVQDGIVRLVFTAGKAAKVVEAGTQNVLEDLCHLLDCNENQIPGRACELFTKWKKVVKKKKEIDSKDLCSIEVFEGDVLVKVCEVLKTQPEHVIKTVKRFKKELGN